MPGINGTLFIRDDYNNYIAHRQLKNVTPEKWAKTERADVIAFLEKHLAGDKQTDPVQEDITAISALLRQCLKEAADIVDTQLEGKNMAPHHKAERIESVGTLLFFKLVELPVVSRASRND